MPHVREWPLDSEFQLSGFRNPYHSGFQIPHPSAFGFQTIVDSGFQQQKFATFQIPGSLTWGDIELETHTTLVQLLLCHLFSYRFEVCAIKC